MVICKLNKNKQKEKLHSRYLLIYIQLCVQQYLSIADNAIWQQQLPSFTKYGETEHFRNSSEPAPSFGKVPSSIEVMPGQTAVLSCIVNNLGDRTVRINNKYSQVIYFLAYCID